MPVYYQGVTDTDPSSLRRGQRTAIYQVEASSKAEAEQKISEWREANKPFYDVSFAGVMTVEEFDQWTGKETIKGIRDDDKPRPDLAQMQQQYAEITLQNIAAGRAQASEETIEKLKEQAGIENVPRELLTPKEFTEAKTLRQLKEGTTLSQYKTYEEMRKPTARQEEAQRIAERAAEETTAAGILTEYRKLPEEYQTPETLKSIAETSKQRQEAYLPLTVLGRPRQITPQEREFIGTPTGFITTLESSYEDRGIIKKTEIERQRELEKQALSIEAQERAAAQRAIQARKSLGLGFLIPSEKDTTLKKYAKIAGNIPYFASGLGTAEFGEQVLITGRKSLFFAKASKEPFIPKEAMKAELKEAGILTLKQSPELLFTAAVGAFIPAGIRTTKPYQSRTVLKQIQKEQPPDIMFRETFGTKRTNIGFRTEEIITTPEMKIRQPTGITTKPFITSKYQYDIAKPAVTIAESVPTPKTTKYFAVTTSKGIQYMTAIKDYKGKTYYMRSIAKPGEKTVTKVFKDDKLLTTIKRKTPEPTITFTEPLQKVKTKEVISMPEFRREAQLQILTSKPVSKISGKYMPIGKRDIIAKEYLQTITEKPKARILAKPIIDLSTGKKTLEPKLIEILPTKYQFVKYKVPEKPLIKTISEEGIFMERPAVSKTTQTQQVTGLGIIKFVKKGKKPKGKLFELPKEDIFKTEAAEKLKQIPILKRLELAEIEGTKFLRLERKAKREAKAERLKILSKTKEKEVEVIKIQRPKAKAEIGELDFYLPAYETTLPRTKAFPLLRTFERTKQELRQEPISLIQPIERISSMQQPKLEPIIKARLIQQPKARQELKIMPKAEQIYQPKTEIRLNQEIKIQQKQLQKQLQLQLKPRVKPPYPRTTITTPPFSPPFIPPIYFPKSEFLEFRKPSKKEKKDKRKFRGTPSLSVVGLGKAAAGTKLTKGQLRGTELISPFAIRKIDFAKTKKKKRDFSYF